MVKSLICVVAALGLVAALAGCVTNAKLHRTSRPEALVVARDVTFALPGGRPTTVRVPAGEYRYAWEDRGYWYYDHPNAVITAHTKGWSPVSRHGGFGIAKEFDEVGVVLYCEPGDLHERGIGDALIALMPKRDGRIVSWEGDIPKEQEHALQWVGQVAR